jgi:hypothetical protein
MIAVLAHATAATDRVGRAAESSGTTQVPGAHKMCNMRVASA